MITVREIEMQDTKFQTCVASASALLRFSSIRDILSLKRSMQQKECLLLSELSKRNADGHVFLSQMADAAREHFVPVLKQQMENNQSVGQDYPAELSHLTEQIVNYAEKVYNRRGSSTELIDTMDSLFAGIEDDTAVRDAKASMALLRDTESVLTEFGDMSNIIENKVVGAYSVLHDKYYNIAAFKAEQIRTLLRNITATEAVVDAAIAAVQIREYYRLFRSQPILDFLNRPMKQIYTEAQLAMLSYRKGETHE